MQRIFSFCSVSFTLHVGVGIFCGPAGEISNRNARLQYTANDSGVIAAFVCNDGFLWIDGSLVKYDLCEDGEWRPLDHSSALWGIGCTGIDPTSKLISHLHEYISTMSLSSSIKS